VLAVLVCNTSAVHGVFSRGLYSAFSFVTVLQFLYVKTACGPCCWSQIVICACGVMYVLMCSGLLGDLEDHWLSQLAVKMIACVSTDKLMSKNL